MARADGVEPTSIEAVLEIDARALCGKYAKPVDPDKFDELPVDKAELLLKLLTPDNKGFVYVDDNGYVTEKFQGFTSEFLKDCFSLNTDTTVIKAISDISNKIHNR